MYTPIITNNAIDKDQVKALLHGYIKEPEMPRKPHYHWLEGSLTPCSRGEDESEHPKIQDSAENWPENGWSMD
jgi:hypothetical protein